MAAAKTSTASKGNAGSGDNVCSPFFGQLNEGSLGVNCFILEVVSFLTLLNGLQAFSASGFVTIILILDVFRGLFGMYAPCPTVRDADLLWKYMLLSALVFVLLVFGAVVALFDEDYNPGFWAILAPLFCASQLWLAYAIREQLNGGVARMPWEKGVVGDIKNDLKEGA